MFHQLVPPRRLVEFRNSLERSPNIAPRLPHHRLSPELVEFEHQLRLPDRNLCRFQSASFVLRFKRMPGQDTLRQCDDIIKCCIDILGTFSPGVVSRQSEGERRTMQSSRILDVSIIQPGRPATPRLVHARWGGNPLLQDDWAGCNSANSNATAVPNERFTTRPSSEHNGR